MNPQLLTFALNLVATAVRVKNDGLTDELRSALASLVAEAQASVLGPQPDGTPWTEAALLAWQAEHDRLLAGIRERHGG